MTDAPTPREIAHVRPGPEALKALSHPLRLKILGRLRMAGPATASGLAERFGLNSGATSYHLRQLEKFGFIEPADELGNRRDRWWRARHEVTRIESVDGAGEVQAMEEMVMELHIDQMRRAVAARPGLDEDWRRMMTASDLVIPMTAKAATELADRITALIFEAMAAAPKLGDPLPPGLRPVSLMLHAFPHPDLGPETVDEAAPRPDADGDAT